MTYPPEYPRPRGHEVRALRDAVKLSQTEFAERLREKVQNIKNWENEKGGRIMPASTWLLAQFRFCKFVPCAKCPSPQSCSSPDIRECLQELAARAGLTYLGPSRKPVSNNSAKKRKGR